MDFFLWASLHNISTYASNCICLQCGKPGFTPWVGKIPWRRKWQPTPVFLPGESHGRKSLVGCNPWGRKESDTIDRLHFHFQASNSHLTLDMRRIKLLVSSAPPLLNPLLWWSSLSQCLRTVVLEKTLESPLDSKEIKPVNPKGKQS